MKHVTRVRVGVRVRVCQFQQKSGHCFGLQIQISLARTLNTYSEMQTQRQMSNKSGKDKIQHNMPREFSGIKVIKSLLINSLTRLLLSVVSHLRKGTKLLVPLKV